MVVQAFVVGDVPGGVAVVEQDGFVGVDGDWRDGEFFRDLLRQTSYSVPATAGCPVLTVQYAHVDCHKLVFLTNRLDRSARSVAHFQQVILDSQSLLIKPEAA